ncbi:MAG: GAF domain-containing protein [Candidatus Fervidibacter sacchari]
MARRIRKNWQWLLGTVAVVVALLLADGGIRYFAWQTNTQAVNWAVSSVAQRWDEFIKSVVSQLLFQRTMSIYEDLFVPSKRGVLLRQAGNWIDEMRESVMADFWVVVDDKGQPVAVMPLGANLPSLRPLWKAPLKSHPCSIALFAGASSEPSLLGLGTDLMVNGEKRGKLWVLYRLDGLSQQLCSLPFEASLELATVKGDVLFRVKGARQASISKPFYVSADLNEVPLSLIAAIPPQEMVKGMGFVRVILLETFALVAIAAALIAIGWRRVADGELAVKLTEIFHSLSERFLETRDAASVFQELAEAIVREFRFSVAVVFRFDKQLQSFSMAGYAPQRLLREFLNQREDSSALNLSDFVLQRLQRGSTYISADCHEFFSLTEEETAVQTLQSALNIQLCWGALLFAEGKPVGALFVGTSQKQFSGEEIQALELVRQQAGMLITMIDNWEEQIKAQERANRFRDTLLWLNKELPQYNDLTDQLRLIAKAAQEALEVSQVSIWQISPDHQYTYCVAAAGDVSEQLEGTVLPLSHYLTYTVSLDEERVIATDSVLTDPRTDELEDYWRLHGIEAAMDAPVRVEGKVVGIVCCEHKAKRQWASDEVAFAGEIADLVAKVILESQQQRRNRYLATLSQLALQLLASTDWHGVLPVFLEDIGKVANADRTFLAKLETNEQGHEVLRCIGVWSVDGLVEDEHEFILSKVGVPHQIEALKTGEGVSCITRTLPEPFRQFYEKRGVKSILVVPVFVESRWWGILGLSARREERYWDDTDIAILKIAGTLLGSVIERQKAIQRQLEQEKQFRELVENAIVGVYRSTPDGRLLMANPALAKMLGYNSPEDLIYSVTDLATQVYADPTHREDFKRMVEEQGSVQNFIAPLKRKDGSKIWAAISGRAVYDANGKLLYYEGFVMDITARKRAEELLTHRVAQLQALYRLASALQQLDGLDEVFGEVVECTKTTLNADKAFIALTEPDGRMKVKASLGFSEETERAIEEFLSQSPKAFLKSPLMVTDVAKASELGSLQEVLLSEGVGSYLCVPIISQGKLVGRLNVSFSQPRRFSEDEIDMAQTIAHHLAFAITRKEAEEQIRRSEREFRSLFENAVVGIYRSTPDGRFLMANETLARINGYSSVEELMALDIPTQIYLNPEDRERFKRLMVEQGFVADYRYPIKRKDGSIGWVTKWARAIKDDNGKVLYYEGFVLDITEQVQMEQRLKALQATARSLVMRLDIESVIQVAVSEISHLYPNSAILIFRYREDEDAFVLESANEEASDLLRVLRLSVGSTLKQRGFPLVEDRLWAGESVLVNDLAQSVGSLAKELTELGYRSIFMRGIGDSSQLWGMIAICRRGETFSQQDTEFLNSFCDYLSIAVRNASLFQQVQQAYEELRGIQERMIEQERLRALGQIASGIAHDINNALVPIQGFAEILLEHNDPVVRDAAEVIFKSANDIAATVQRMREFYRVRSSEDVLEPVDLNAICKDALMMTKPKWFNMPRERGIVIETRLELADDLPPLTGIPSEIRQAIINLIINAVDAMPEGGILTIRTFRRDKGGRAWAVVEVCDTGIGMDEETKRRAIEPFFTTKGEKGSGLGLAAVYGTVQRHEGFMEIDSAPGEGTTVRLWLPSNVAQISELPAGEVPSLKLLVIDDEPSVRETLALLLRKDGHLVLTAADGEEGLEMFQLAQIQGNPFNVVITDLGMPRMDGLTVARKIKAISPDTPVILLSGWGFRIRSEEVREAIDLVLTKPATYQQIRRALSQIWNRRMAITN